VADISIIVPSYNSERFLRATLDSLLQQSVQDWECIIVDDGSTDGSPQFAREYAAKDSRFRYLRQPNSGRAIACNTGYAAAAAESRYLFFLDSDDVLAPEALETLRSYLEAHPDVGVVGCQFEVIDGEGRDVGPGDRSRWVPAWPLARRLKDSEFETPFVTFFCATGQGPFAMIRRSVFEKTAGFEPALSPFSAHEDTDIFCQLALHAAVHYIPQRVYLKRDHGGNITHSFERITQSYDVFRKKWNSFKPATPEQAKTLREARKFYHGTFLPLRDCKVGFKALREAITGASVGKLGWSMRLFRSALTGFCQRGRLH
jgi:glycosyltransferase involved in cell wall biosynthesis